MTSIDDRRSVGAGQVQNNQVIAPPVALARSVAAATPDLPGSQVDYGAIAAAMSPEARIGKAIDEARDAFLGPYSVNGQRVLVQPQFRMKGGYESSHGTFAHEPEPNIASFAKELTPKGRELVAILSRAGDSAPGAVMLGYPRAGQLVRATQALIDAGKLPSLPPPATTADCIRKMQWDWGIGIDCVDWCMNALAHATGRSLDAMGLSPGADPFGASGTRTPRGFARVAVTAARAGDVVTLNNPADPPGHRVIVRERSAVAANDPTARDLVAKWGATARAFFGGAGPFHVMQVDSSWGAEDGKPFGGYRRDTWVLDEGSNAWMSYSPHTGEVGVHVSQAGPAGEALEGVYRWSAS